MITLRQLTLARGSKLLLEGIDLTLHAGQKIGVVGPNGCGKSSLFALLLGELHQEAGDLELPGRLAVAHVAQNIPASEQAAIEFVIDGDAPLRALEQALAGAHAQDDGERLAALYEALDHAGGYSARSRAASLMHGLGFAASELEQAVDAFSGGWRMRLKLARALMCRSDLLLLDEPTNHLDLDAVIWLEQWLRDYPGTLLAISHDRDFLDGTVGHILAIEQCKAKLYTGNYSAFEVQRAMQLAQQQSAYLKQQREIAHLHSYVERFRAKATKARQAQSRLKALARMEVISPAHVDTPFDFRMREPLAGPDPLLTLEDAAAGYDGRAVLAGIKLSIAAGGRIGLLGRNGAGKSTLIKLLSGTLAPLQGTRQEGKGLAIGYFAQHQIEVLRPDESPLRHLMRLDPRTREQELRDFLGGFDFRGDMALEPIAPFSGGEKARLALALLVWQRPNLLLLDEPTNHLDLEMRHALTLALQEYEGAIVLVSHDRHLLRTTAANLWLVANGAVQPFDGDLDDYRDWLRQREAGAGTPEPAGATRKQQKRDEALARNQRYAQRKPLAQRLAKIERRMAELERERKPLGLWLADPESYADKEKLQSALLREAALRLELERAEAEWLALQAEMELLDL
ncbi:MAG: ATP-binding cassette domain-containing protein [Betaproteobacteria bacterium]|nr:MAG: ATP-binding cassette domain-containing protein [Betaproteobacteria bacterium]